MTTASYEMDDKENKKLLTNQVKIQDIKTCNINNSSISPEPSANTSTKPIDIPIFGHVLLQAKRRHIVYAKHLYRR
jgi:hypothetical protein